MNRRKIQQIFEMYKVYMLVSENAIDKYRKDKRATPMLMTMTISDGVNAHTKNFPLVEHDFHKERLMQIAIYTMRQCLGNSVNARTIVQWSDCLHICAQYNCNISTTDPICINGRSPTTLWITHCEQTGVNTSKPKTLSHRFSITWSATATGWVDNQTCYRYQDGR